MKRMKKILSLILVCSLVLSTFAINAGAASENGLGKDDLTYLNVRDDNALELYGLYMENESIFNEDFSATDITDIGVNGTGWTGMSDCTLEDGVLKKTTGARHAYLNTDAANNWTNYTVEADVTVLNGENDVVSTSNKFASIAVAAVGSTAVNKNSGYEFMISFDKSDTSKATYSLKDRMNTDSAVNDTSYSLQIGTTYTLKMVVNGKTISCYIDDVCVIENHAINTTSDLKGTIGLYSGGNVATFDNVVVYKESNLFPRMDLAVAEDISNGVLAHAKETSGGRIRFKTDSSYVAIKAELPTYITQNVDDEMGNGKYGFDVYVDTAEGSTYAGTIAPETTEVPTENQAWSYEGVVEFATAEERNITIYFPILQEVSDVYVGVQETATVAAHAIPYEDEAPIVYYGSSITQGASSTRPGLTYVNTIGRMLNRDYINLGMYGSCKAETEFANYIAGLDMSIFVFDHDHNYNTDEELKVGHEPFYKIVRAAHPDIPIIFISRPSKTAEWEDQREVIRTTYNNAIANGDNNVYFIDGQSFFNGDSAYLADTVHPNDAGQEAMANGIGAVLQGIVEGAVDDSAYLYYEDFSCNNVTDLGKNGIGWSTMDSWQLTGDGWLKSTKANYNYLIFKDGEQNSASTTWSDYTFEADVVITTDEHSAKNSNGRYISLIVGADASKFTNLNSATGFEFMLSCSYTKGSDYTTASKTYAYQLKDRDKISGSDTLVSSKTYNNFEMGDIVNLKMEVNGAQIKCYIDGVLKETVTVPNTNAIMGAIGLHTAGNVCKIDNMRVYKTGTLPWFGENFGGTTTEIGTSGTGWTLGGNYEPTETGELRTIATGNNNYCYLDNDEALLWSNYTVEADVVLEDLHRSGTEPNARAASILAAVDALPSGTNKAAGYEFAIYYDDRESAASMPYFCALKDRESTGAGSSNIKINYTLGDTVKLKMVLNGNNIKCYIDDVLMVDKTVSSVTTLTGTIGVRGLVNYCTFDNISVRPNTQAFNNYFDSSLYREGRDSYVHPFREGKVFAGWYADAKHTIALSPSVTSGKAYAKFVDENVLSVQAQLDASTLAASDTGTTKMRFVTTVDNLDYQKVGFTVSTTNKTANFDSTTAYKNIVAKDSNTAINYAPSYFSSDSEYFITIILKNLAITETDLDKVFTVTPYWVTADGTRVTGITRDADNNPITIRAGINKNLETQGNAQ